MVRVNQILAAFDADQRRRNQEDRRRVFEPRRHKHAHAETAPMPTDPSRCRWCGGRLKALLPNTPADFCLNLCAPNAVAPYLGHCSECGRDFETAKHRATLCYECERQDVDQIEAVERQLPAVRTRDRWAERRSER